MNGFLSGFLDKLISIKNVLSPKRLLERHKKTVILSSILFIVLVGLGTEAAMSPQILNGQIDSVYAAYQNAIHFQPWKKSSQVYVSVDDNRITLKFKVIKDEAEKVAIFAQNLGVSQNFLQGISFEIDEATRAKLQQFTPATLNLDMSDRRLGFSTPNLKGLESSLIKDKLNFATSSANISIKVAGDREFKALINDPEPLLKYATQSGQISLSEKLEPLFPILSKVGTIRLEVNGSHIEGEIVLK